MPEPAGRAPSASPAAGAGRALPGKWLQARPGSVRQPPELRERPGEGLGLFKVRGWGLLVCPLASCLVCQVCKGCLGTCAGARFVACHTLPQNLLALRWLVFYPHVLGERSILSHLPRLGALEDRACLLCLFKARVLGRADKTCLCLLGSVQDLASCPPPLQSGFVQCRAGQGLQALLLLLLRNCSMELSFLWALSLPRGCTRERQSP